MKSFDASFLRRGKKGRNEMISASCGKHTDARMEDTKDWSANNLLISDWLDESFVLSCTDN
jgi:hypothetical protein